MHIVALRLWSKRDWHGRLRKVVRLFPALWKFKSGIIAQPLERICRLLLLNILGSFPPSSDSLGNFVCVTGTPRRVGSDCGMTSGYEI